MAFNIVINAYVNNVVVNPPLLNESNCDTVVLVKNDFINVENGGIINNLYKIQCTTNPTSEGKTIDIRKTYFDGSKIYFLTKIYACVYNSPTNERTITPENLINKFGEILTLETNTELKCIYEDRIPICVTPDNPYCGDPFILYGNECNDTQKVKEISINGGCDKFWICENKTSYESVDFTEWRIHIREVVYRNNNGDNSFSDNIYTTGIIPKGDEKLLNLATVTFNLDVNNSDMDLYLVRNENVLSLKNLKKSSIYGTFTGCISPGTITDRLNKLKSEDKTVESIGYYLEAEACYEPKNVHITVWRRNTKPIYTLEYKFASDISDKSITAPKRGGHVFDGFYINPKIETDPNFDDVPKDNEILDSNHVRVTNSNGNFVQYAKNFLDGGIYINPVDYKYVKANYRKAETLITLNWQADNKQYYNENGSIIYSIANDTVSIKFKENTSGKKITNIPKLKRKSNWTSGPFVDLTFMGFYTEKNGQGVKVIKADGNFKTDLPKYTSAGLWVQNKNLYGDNTMTLYAYWTSGSYIELDHNGGEDGSKSFTVQYKENMSKYNLLVPKKYIDPDDKTSDQWTFDGYWYYAGDYKTRVTRDDGGFKLYVEDQYGNKITNGARQWLLQAPITLQARWYSDRYMVYANSNLEGCTAEVDGRNKVKKKVNNTVNLTVSYDKLRFNFNGWSLNDETDIFNTNETVKRTILTSDVNSVDNRIDYNANFEDRRYTIYYKDPDSGHMYARLRFFYDDLFQNLFIPQKAGYKFVGWFTDKAFTNQVTYINEGNGGIKKGPDGTDVAKTNLTSNGTVQEITLYAKWEKITILGRFILKPGVGKWKSGVQPPTAGTSVVYGNKMPEINEDLIPVLEGYSFMGFYDKSNYQVINKECTDWIKNTDYVDGDGNSIMTDTYEFTARFSKDINFGDVINILRKTLNCNITTHSNVDFNNSIENKIATIDWINTTIGIPEVDYYEDLIKNFYNNSIEGMEEGYNSDKGLADKYFFNDFNVHDNKLLKQTDIIDFFDNSATKLENQFYLKEINYDILNNKTIMRVNFIEKKCPFYPEGYSGPKDTVIYFTINDDKSVVYKMSIDEINFSTKIETSLQYFDIEFPYLTDYINKITIEHIPCFAIDNLDNTRTYYKPYVIFNKFNTLDLTIEENTILNNTEIKEYDSDSLMNPVFPGGGSIS